MSISLYQLSKEFQDFSAIYEMADTEEEMQEALLTLQGLNTAIGEKLSNCCGYLKGLKAFEDVLDSEIERLTKKREVLRKKQEGFKAYMQSILIAGEKWTDGRHSIAWRASESVEITDEALIPEQYLRQKVTVVPDKIEIKNHLKIGATIPGATLKQTQNLNIK